MANTLPYFQFFGSNAGPVGLGYYSYAAGPWHIVVLNSEIDAGAGSAQEQWLRADLASHPTRCTAAYWHRPLFSSGTHGSNRDMLSLWRALYEFEVEVMINGARSLAMSASRRRIPTASPIRSTVSVSSSSVPAAAI